MCAGQELEFALKIFNYFFTSMFVIEAAIKTISLGVVRYITDRYRPVLPVSSTISCMINCLSPLIGLRSIVMSMSVCVCVCMFSRITWKPRGRTLPIFRACCLWPPLTAFRYVMYFRFCGWRHVLHDGRMARHVYSLAAIEYDKNDRRDKDWKFLLWVAHQGVSLLSTIALITTCTCLYLL